MGIIMKDGHQYGIGGIERAEDVSYDNTESGMTATDVQGALDELSAGLTNLLERTSASTTVSVGGSHTAFSISASKAGYTSMLYVLHYNNASTVILNVEGVTFGNGSFQCNGYARRENSSEAVSETIVAEILWVKN